MIVLWAGAVFALLSLLRYSARLSAGLRTVAWPDEEPLNVHDNRAQDPHLAKLGRMLNSDLIHEAHHVVVDVTEGLLNSGSVVLYVDSTATARRQLGPGVAQFLIDPPLANPSRYRNELADVLTRIEGL